jgi:hypothetical protein
MTVIHELFNIALYILRAQRLAAFWIGLYANDNVSIRVLKLWPSDNEDFAIHNALKDIILGST